MTQFFLFEYYRSSLIAQDDHHYVYKNRGLYLLKLIVAARKNVCTVKPAHFFFICHIYPSFMREQIVLLYFKREVRTRLRAAISKVFKPPVFHMKVGVSL